MSQGPTRVERLVRLNQFREDRASGVLREATVQQQQAQERHQSATADLDRLGEWKLRGSDDGMDLAFYHAALDLEQVAMEQAEQLQQTLTASEQRTEQAHEALVAAACAMRVSENRGKREHASAELVREKRSFDQISDVWLNNRELSSD